MAEIVNLRQTRKARDKAAAKARADVNAAKHGQTKANRTRQEAEADLAARRLDAHRRDVEED